MKYLLHGDDVASSRKFLTGLTDGFKITYFEGKNLKIKDLEEALLSTSLFDEKKAVVIENLLSKNAKKKDFINFLNDKKADFLVILWEDKKLPKTSFSSLKDIKVQDFLLPNSYFQFLDSFYPGNGSRLYNLYHELLRTMPEELVFYSLIKRVRFLLILNEGGVSDELQKMASWQIDKLRRQQNRWKQANISNFYSKLQQTEIKLKSGKLPVPLSKHLDILILSEL